MAATLKEVEAIPASYPNVTGLSLPAAMLDQAALWQRIEAYCRMRWTVREVVWTVEGEGAWEAPLTPAILNTVEVWESGAWAECTPAASPWGGYDLPGDGPYRITADVGSGDVPAAVSEAFRRLAEEATDKLGSAVMLDVMRPLQAFDAGGRARAITAIVGALAQAKEAGVDPSDALRLVDWEV